jgi:UDP-N-acetylglucosamine--N-acetylmuramyl-(pentapeptide) pyrophosphoryl-undecaprenol N-acetylglucosamine transferase
LDFLGSRVYFAANGIGFGHVSRDSPIAEEVERRGGEVMFSTFLDGVDYARQHGFRVVSAPSLTMMNDESGGIDLRLSGIKQGIVAPSIFLSQVRFELRAMKQFRPDVVVSDSRLSSIHAAKLLGVPVISILNQFTPLVPRQVNNFGLRFVDASVMTLLGWMWAWSDIILIPDFKDPYTLSIENLRIPEPYKRKVRFIGAILTIKPKECKPRSNTRINLEVSEDQHLVFAGISGPKTERLPLLRILEPIFESFPDSIRVVMSLGTPMGGSKPIVKGSLIKVPWLEDRFSVLNASDAIVSRGGHETIMQSISFQKPALVIPVPNHPEQYGNARTCKRLGVAEIMHQRDITHENLLQKINALIFDKSYKNKLEEVAKHTHLGEGVEETMQALASVL